MFIISCSVRKIMYLNLFNNDLPIYEPAYKKIFVPEHCSFCYMIMKNKTIKSIAKKFSKIKD